MICKKCGTENETNALFCKSCGNNLNEEVNANLNETSQIQNTVNSNSQNKNKIIVIAIIVFLVAVVLVFVFMSFKPSNQQSDTGISGATEKDYFSYKSDALCRIEKDDKYGYIDYDGNIVIEPQFAYAEEFNDDYAVVKIDNTDNRGIYSIIDRKGNVIMESNPLYNKIKHYNEGTYLVDNKLYDKDLKRIGSESIDVGCNGSDCRYFYWKDETTKTQGILDLKGNFTYTRPYINDPYIRVEQNIVSNKLLDNYCLLTIEVSKYSIVNCDTGVVVYESENDIIINDKNNIFKIKDRVSRNITKLIYVEDDKVAFETSAENTSLLYDEDGYLIVSEKDENNRSKYKYLTENGLVEQKPIAKSLDYVKLYDGYKITKCDNKYGLSKDGKEVLSCKYDDISLFTKDLSDYLKTFDREYVIVTEDGITKLYDLKNNKIELDTNIPAYPFIRNSGSYRPSESLFINYKVDDTTYLYNVLTRRSLKIEENMDLERMPNNDFVIFETDEGLKYYNSEFKLLFTGQ